MRPLLLALLLAALCGCAAVVATLEDWREPAPETQRAQEDEHE